MTVNQYLLFFIKLGFGNLVTPISVVADQRKQNNKKKQQTAKLRKKTIFKY